MKNWITTDPSVLGGKPCIRGTRISVEFILELIASGASRDEIMGAYPQITPAALSGALMYASRAMKNEVVWEVKVKAG